jgi:nicotinamidase-related amidase
VEEQMSHAASRLIDRSETVLVVIDVQEKLLPHIHDGERVVRNIVKLIRFAEILGIPVLAAEQAKLGSTVGPIRDALGRTEPISKVAFGALGCGAFLDRLSALGRRALLLTGIEAHICVAQTALQALPAYTVQVVADAVGSRDPANREVALGRLASAGVVVTSTEMAMYELLREAGTEEFRKILPLVK